jgi:arylsulfatase A-like enzyme
MIYLKIIKINTRQSLVLLYLLLAGTIAFGQSSKPNIIYILSDDQAWNDYGFMGHPHIETPNIDRLALEGMTFTRGYVTAPLCSPSLASIITGLYPQQHRITGNDPTFPFDERQRYRQNWMMERSKNYKPYLDKFQENRTVPQLLGEKGYVSFQSGKWWGGNFKEGGFTAGMTHGDPAKGGRHGDEGLKIGREGLNEIFDFMDKAVKNNNPFFVWYAPFLPHSPHNPPDSLLQKYLEKAPSKPIAQYWAMCEWFDITVGQLLEGLEDKGLTENTLVIYVCDNGWIQDPEVANLFVPGSKQAPQDMGIRTPMIFKWPSKIMAKMDTTTLVSSIDMAATTLAAVEINQLPNMQGVNIMDEKALKKRDKVYSVDFSHDMVQVDKYAESLENRMIITENWKLIVPDVANRENQEILLYNIFEDPYEKENLATKHPKIVKALKKDLNKWWERSLN